jgi:RhoGAP domain/LIM domain
LCKKIVAFFALLSKTQETGVRKLGVTQELLSLVTGLAHYLKLLIRICLQGALKVERETQNTDGLNRFLNDLADMDFKDDERSLESGANIAGLAAASSDQCPHCLRPIEDECVRNGERRWHLTCIGCNHCGRDLSRSLGDARLGDRDNKVYCSSCDNRVPGTNGIFIRVTRLQQYVFLLRVALARLLSILRNTGTFPNTSGDSNLNGYKSREGQPLPGQPDFPILKSDSRSKSFGGPLDERPQESSYESTLNDVRRLRSTRMDKHLSSTIKRARTSRIMDGPEGQSVRPGSSGANGSDLQNNPPHIIEERDLNGESRSELLFSHQDALTLDDIPRIVAAEQAREHRPNAYKHARHELFRTSITEPKLVNGHQRTFSGGNELDGPMATNEPSPQQGGPGKKYFSELTALEYFIVRHVAVLSMQPLLEGHFTLEELLGLIESRKPTFWNKLGKAFKNDGNKAGKKKGVFGVPLDTIIERDGADSTEGIGPGTLRIPALVDDAITTMRKMDLSVEGVFRKNGNIKRLNETVAIIDKEGCDGVDLSKENVVQVAAILKKYLRELPDPLLTFKLHRLYITSQKISDEEKRRRVLHLTCCLLPKSHRDCLEVLFSFLNWVASFHQVDEESGSKMDTHNLATVIAPNILFTNSKNAGMDDSFLAIEAVHSLIECNEQMCQASLAPAFPLYPKSDLYRYPKIYSLS